MSLLIPIHIGIVIFNLIYGSISLVSGSVLAIPQIAFGSAWIIVAYHYIDKEYGDKSKHD